MGMFDSFYDEAGNEWQTKAYRCGLDVYRVGDKVPFIEGTKDLTDYQVAIIGETPDDPYTDSLATIRGDVLVAIHAKRDPSLPRLDYFGNVRERVKP